MQNTHMETRIGGLEVSFSARGNPTYTLDLWHDGLKKHRLIRGDNQSIVQLKAQLQVEEWQQKWAEVSSRQQQRSERALGKRQQEERKAEAQERTSDAQQELELLAALLKTTLTVDDKVDWESLKDTTAFPEPRPKAAKLPTEPSLPSLPREPQRTDSKYQRTLGLLDKLFSSRRSRLQEEVAKLFAADLDEWKRDVSELRRNCSAANSTHEQKLRDTRAMHEKEVAAWEAKRQEFLTSQAAKNEAVDAKRIAYEAGRHEAIVEYMDLVLSTSRYPDYFPQEFDIEYDPSAKTAIVDY
jgi:restriction system protein